MEKTADIVIIGGGIIGISIAYYLALKKAGKILLLEKGQLGEGSTSRCVGGIRTQFSTEINICFSLESIKTFKQFEEEFAINPEFKQIGYLFLATTKQEEEIFKGNIELQRKYGIPVEFLNSDEIKARWPFLRIDDLRGGTFCPWDGYAGTNEVFSGYVRGAKREGVKIYEDSEVIEISINREKITGIKTKNEEISTSIIVNAAGPHASSIGDMVGVKVPVKPLRRQIFVTSPFHLTHHSIPLTIDIHRGWYFRQEGDGLLLSGPLDKEPTFNLNVDYEAMAEASENAVYRVPALEKACIARGWAGLYEISPDNHAILGKVPEVEGLVLANGFSGHGFQHCPAVGKVVAELILEGRATTIDITPLSLERFKKGKLILEPMTAFKE